MSGYLLILKLYSKRKGIAPECWGKKGDKRVKRRFQIPNQPSKSYEDIGYLLYRQLDCFLCLVEAIYSRFHHSDNRSQFLDNFLVGEFFMADYRPNLLNGVGI